MALVEYWELARRQLFKTEAEKIYDARLRDLKSRERYLQHGLSPFLPLLISLSKELFDGYGQITCHKPSDTIASEIISYKVISDSHWEYLDFLEGKKSDLVVSISLSLTENDPSTSKPIVSLTLEEEKEGLQKISVYASKKYSLGKTETFDYKKPGAYNQIKQFIEKIVA